MSYFKDKIVVITGASSGVGKSIARALYTENAKLLLLGRNVNELDKEFPGSYVHIINLKNDFEIKGFADIVIKNYDKIDILIHCAGIIYLGNVETLPVEELDEQYQINTRAPFLLTQKLLPSVKKAKGQIVFLNSTAGLQTRETLGSYSSSKFALKAIADSLRLEVRFDGVNVLSVFLGATATPMQEKIQTTLGKKFIPDRFMKPEEIAKALLSVMQKGETAGITDITIKDHIETNY